MNLHSILSPIDFSEQSRLALRWAGAFATRFNARLTVASVVDPVLAEASRIRSGRDLVKAETETALREFVAATWREGAPAQTAFDTTVGDAATAIRDMADAHGAGLIAMGTHGLGGFRKWLLGSTTERVLRRTRVPVLAVPPADESQAPAGAAGQVSHLVAATDFSEPSVEAMAVAAEWGREFAAAMTVAHVVEPLAVAAQWQSLVDDSTRGRVDGARRRLQALVQSVCRAQACEQVVAVGGTAEEIAAIAADRQAQMIVMGLGSGSGSRPGSIAYRVLRLSPIPVLVVPAA